MQPFVGEIEDYRAFFEKYFLQLEADKSLIVPDRWIQVFIPARTAPGNGALDIRRQQVENDFSEVIRTVMEKKVTKLVAQPADKHVLILERQHMNLVPKQILDEVRNQAVNFPLMASVDEVWILETIGYQPGGHYLFELYDNNDRHLAEITCEGTAWTSRSGKDGIPICNY